MNYEYARSGISPVNGKVQGISENLRPTNFKEFRSFLRAHHFRYLFSPKNDLKNDKPCIWTEQHEALYSKVNQELKEITQN